MMTAVRRSLFLSREPLVSERQGISFVPVVPPGRRVAGVEADSPDSRSARPMADTQHGWLTKHQRNASQLFTVD